MRTISLVAVWFHYGCTMVAVYLLVVLKSRKKVPTWQDFNMLLERVSLEDKTGHLFLVDIRFNRDETTPKQLMYNELYCPILKKKK